MIEPASTAEELREETQAMSSSQLDHLRLLAKNNLYFMSKGVLGFNDVNKATHGAFCKFMENEQYLRKMALMPRFHLKTTIATEADSIRLACKSEGDARILIANEVLQNSIDIIGAIQGHFEHNELLRQLFGNLIPSRFSGPGIQWSSVKGVRLLRKHSYKEPTFLPIGVGGAVTSKHFTRIKCDDLIGLEAKRSPATMKQAKDWNNNIESLVVGALQTWIDWIGTRWMRNDLYGYIMQQYADELKVFRRSVVEDGEIIFPAKITRKFLEQLQKTPDVYFSQFMNNPVSAEAMDFDEDDLRYFVLDGQKVRFMGDEGRPDYWSIESLDRVVAVDPNSGKPNAPDESSIGVLGRAPDERDFTLEIFNGRPDPTKFIDTLYDLCMKWRPRVVGIEEAGQQNTLHYFKEKMREHGVYFRVEPLKPGNRDKEYRIRTALHPRISTRMLYLQKRQTDAIMQLINFPDTDLKDIADVLAYGEMLLKTPEDLSELEEAAEAEDFILRTRNKMTGW